jgi:hypothetical protein
MSFMTTILSLPYDVFVNVLIEFLPTTALKVLERVSQATRATVLHAAGNRRTELALGNKKIWVILSGSVADYFRNHLTKRVLSTHREFFDRITTAQEELEKKGETYDPNDSTLVLINHAKKKADNALMLALVPFDFHGKEPIIKANEEPGCLGDLMITAIRKNDTELLRLVLAHHNAKDIQCDGEYGLIAAMKEVIKSSKNAAQLKLLSSHPNAEEIQEDILDDRLGELLIETVKVNNLNLVKEILLLPNAKNIPAEGKFGLEGALQEAVETRNLEIASNLLAQPNASKISCQKFKSIVNAAQVKEDSEMVQLLKGFFSNSWGLSGLCL